MAYAQGVLVQPTLFCRNADPLQDAHAAPVPKVEHLPIPHPDWSPESGERQAMPYEGQPFKELDPAVCHLSNIHHHLLIRECVSMKCFQKALSGLLSARQKPLSEAIDIVILIRRALLGAVAGMRLRQA